MIAGSARFDKQSYNPSQKGGDNSELNITRYSKSFRKTILKSVTEQKEEGIKNEVDLYEGFFQNFDRGLEYQDFRSNARMQNKTNITLTNKPPVANRLTE